MAAKKLKLDQPWTLSDIENRSEPSLTGTLGSLTRNMKSKAERLHAIKDDSAEKEELKRKVAQMAKNYQTVWAQRDAIIQKREYKKNTTEDKPTQTTTDKKIEKTNGMELENDNIKSDDTTHNVDPVIDTKTDTDTINMTQPETVLEKQLAEKRKELTDLLEKEADIKKKISEKEKRSAEIDEEINEIKNNKEKERKNLQKQLDTALANKKHAEGLLNSPIKSKVDKAKYVFANATKKATHKKTIDNIIAESLAAELNITKQINGLDVKYKNLISEKEIEKSKLNHESLESQFKSLEEDKNTLTTEINNLVLEKTERETLLKGASKLLNKNQWGTVKTIATGAGVGIGAKLMAGTFLASLGLTAIPVLIGSGFIAGAAMSIWKNKGSEYDLKSKAGLKNHSKKALLSAATTCVSFGIIDNWDSITAMTEALGITSTDSNITSTSPVLEPTDSIKESNAISTSQPTPETVSGSASSEGQEKTVKTTDTKTENIEIKTNDLILSPLNPPEINWSEETEVLKDKFTLNSSCETVKVSAHAGGAEITGTCNGDPLKVVDNGGNEEKITPKPKTPPAIELPKSRLFDPNLLGGLSDQFDMKATCHVEINGDVTGNNNNFCVNDNTNTKTSSTIEPAPIPEPPLAPDPKPPTPPTPTPPPVDIAYKGDMIDLTMVLDGNATNDDDFVRLATQNAYDMGVDKTLIEEVTKQITNGFISTEQAAEFVKKNAEMTIELKQDGLYSVTDHKNIMTQLMESLKDANFVTQDVSAITEKREALNLIKLAAQPS